MEKYFEFELIKYGDLLQNLCGSFENRCPTIRFIVFCVEKLSTNSFRSF